MTDIFRVKKSPQLSFCIPTYNRVEVLISLVLRVLTTPSSEVEVIVLDNGSSDDTLNRLAAIDDPRLVVISNKTNCGAIFNQLNVLLQGRGKYSALLLDKDSVDPALIPSFLEFLRQELPFCGYCEYNKPIGTPPQIYQTSGTALLSVAYSCHHPTGYFFQTAALQEINILERFTDSEYVGNFPFEFMQAELCLRGPAAIFNEPLFSPESLEAAQATKSFSINASKENAFFSPQGRLKIAVSFSTHILSLPIPQEMHRELLLKQFARGLQRSTFEFRLIMRNEAICEHYHINSRKVSTFELLNVAWVFYRGFSQRIIQGQKAELNISSLDLFAYSMRRIIKSIWLRLNRQFS